MITSNRLRALRRKQSEKGTDAVLISQPANRYYLSGFNGSDGLLIISQQSAVLATDFRYIEQAKQQAPEYEVFRISGSLAEWLPGLLSRLGINSLGFEGGHITFDTYGRLKAALDGMQPQIGLVALDRLVEALRAIKEPEEIALIARAAGIADRAYDCVVETIRAGMTEEQAAWEMEKALRENGSDGLPFDIIVASGPNAALPHHRPSRRVINDGEPVVIDMGARFEGYGSDLSRTICPGAPDAQFKKVYNTVLDAQMAAMSIIRPGMTGAQADDAARKVIQAAGYGEAFGHALGHGVGLEPHESPRLGPGSDETLVSGMVFTVEPGIYLPGWGGVRIEDMAVLEQGELRVISQAGKVNYDKRQ